MSIDKENCNSVEKAAVKHRVMVSLCLLIFIDSIGVGLIFPIMPALFMDSVHGLIQSNSSSARELLYGIAFAVYPLAGFFGMPIFGALSDSFGRRKLMLIGLLGMIIGYGISAYSVLIHNCTLFLISRFISGFCAGTYTIANAAVSDISKGVEGKIDNFRWPIIASLSGFILGPAISSLIGFFHLEVKLSIPFFLAVILSVVNWIMLYFSFKETFTPAKDKSAVMKSLTSIVYTFKKKGIRALSIVYCLFQFGFGLFIQSISIYLASEFGYSPKLIGVFFVMLGMVTVVSVMIQPKVAKLVDYRKTISISLIVMGFLMLIMTIFSSGLMPFDMVKGQWIIWVISSLFYLAIPFSNLGMAVLFSVSVPEEEQGQIMGGLGQMYSIMWFVGALLVGYLLSKHSGMVFLLAFISYLASFILLIYIGVRNEKSHIKSQ